MLDEYRFRLTYNNNEFATVLVMANKAYATLRKIVALSSTRFFTFQT
jgi:hypothetical protein